MCFKIAIQSVAIAVAAGLPLTKAHVCVVQVWFQNRRSKERRMKQLSALGARRHAFFRSPRRMRTLVDRLEPGELIPNGPFSYYGGKGAMPMVLWSIHHFVIVR